jgi:PiT family inorganic phosphate transporter
VALSSAITVILASWLGLPVSSTHIAVGAVFGVGFFREYYTARSKRRRDMVRKQRSGNGDNNGNGNSNGNSDEAAVAPEELRHRKLVRRAHFMTIVAAWLVTVPATALLSAAIFWGLNLVR